ncbi:MAG: EamA family transporter [Acidimicrobiaceae bacterium]|jgi:drug/metabolite transporter (DMT)-like permease|nr:EamA family transporter [Acidimicrobiaceae bacterium]MBT5580752.1 EamA family transporter [Acidimicrobiaceae bacterium]MDG1410518.1 EamA family transporter [Acidimicrobiales bacterium]MDG2217878.1 EamA family transporter [Acidimicrobiales bacterium]
MSNRLVLATVFLVAILIGANFTMLKFALDHTTPMLLASLRTVVGGTFLVGFALMRGERIPRRRDDLGNIFVVSFSITTVSSALLVFGVNRVPAGVASLMSSTMPLFTAVLSALLLGAAVSRVAGVGLAVGLGGTAILASPSLSGETAAVGIISLAVSALAWAFGNVYMKWRDFSRVSAVMLVGVQLVMSAVVLVPFALLVEGTAETEWTVGLFAPLLYAAIPANAVTFALMATIVSRATPTQASATAYLIPAFGVFFGWLIRDEVLGAAEVIGGALVVAGVYVLVTSNARRAESIQTSASSVDSV